MTSLHGRATRTLSASSSLVVVLAACAFLATTSAQAAPASWWQLSSGARPGHLQPGAGRNEVQELSTTTAEFEGNPEQAAFEVSVGGTGVGAFATEPTAAAFGLTPLTEAELQAALETAYGAGDVSVTQKQTEPGEPLVFLIESEGELAFGQGEVERVESSPFGIGEPQTKVLFAGRPDGEIVLTAENLGYASVDAEASPVTIADTLPPGLEALAIAASRPIGNTTTAFPCQPATLTCTFSGEGSPPGLLPPYELLEVRIAVNVKLGAESGELNRAAISGGTAPSASVSRPVTFASSSSESTPFGVEDFRTPFEEAGGAPATRAGSHPFQFSTTVAINEGPALAPLNLKPEAEPAALAKDVYTKFPSGFIGNPTQTPTCSLAQFLTNVNGGTENACPASSAVGVASVTVSETTFLGTLIFPQPLFNLEPSFGETARFGFYVAVAGLPVVLDASLRSGPGEGALPGQSEDYGVDVNATNISQTAGLLSARVTTWGVPGDPRHDASRGWGCLGEAREDERHAPCNPSAEPHPPAFITLPTSCTGPLQASVEADSWSAAGLFSDYLPFEPLPALDSCNQVPFGPTIEAEPTSNAATSPTGLNFDLDLANEGFTGADGISASELKKTVVTLPQGFTTNPSVAEGLKACSLAEYNATTVTPGTGCTDESKIGTVEVQSPVVKQTVKGSLYVARQHENPYGNLLTLYMVLRNPELGVIIKQALEVKPDQATGQLTTTLDNSPQLPISHFHLAFRQGQRSPLITPPTCGTYTVSADLYPWSNPSAPFHRESSFQITQGPEGQPCPSGNTPPFHPNLEAGTINNAAGTYSPFFTKITRRDSEQEITHFSIKLPPGIAGILAGIPYCPDSAIAAAKSLEKEGGGSIEEANPSCPGASQVGHSLVGSGVGNVLAYAPGKIYLAGPYHGSNLSLVSITAAKVGPFDLGTVVVRFALRVDPETAEVFVDSTGSDPIPHIVDGIPVHLRDIRAYVDRPNFIFNPTSCAKTSTASTVLGSGLDFVSAADDNPVTVSSPFQAADCASLAFKPKLAISLKGSTKRGGAPALKAVVTYPYPGANIAAAQVTLPPSEFLNNAHIGTVCTRVIFKEGTVPGEKCPAQSVYGYAVAVTPVFEEPLEGPVYLRSTGTEAGAHILPDLVAALHNKQVDIALAGHTEGTKGGGIRNTFEAVPDAPVTKFTLQLKGGQKSLLENHVSLCARKHYADAVFTGHNGKLFESKPVVSVTCKKHKKRK